MRTEKYMRIANGRTILQIMADTIKEIEHNPNPQQINLIEDTLYCINEMWLDWSHSNQTHIERITYNLLVETRKTLEIHRETFKQHDAKKVTVLISGDDQSLNQHVAQHLRGLLLKHTKDNRVLLNHGGGVDAVTIMFEIKQPDKITVSVNCNPVCLWQYKGRGCWHCDEKTRTMIAPKNFRFGNPDTCDKTQKDCNRHCNIERIGMFGNESHDASLKNMMQNAVNKQVNSIRENMNDQFIGEGKPR